MKLEEIGKPIEILLVEDNPGDVRLTRETFKDAKVLNNLSVVEDGTEAMLFLHKSGKYAGVSRPDLILLDLNLPRMDGLEVLAEIKTNKDLKQIPVAILTISQAEEDIMKSYNLGANCFITKPVDLNHFVKIVKSIEDFWLTFVKLPQE